MDPSQLRAARSAQLHELELLHAVFCQPGEYHALTSELEHTLQVRGDRRGEQSSEQLKAGGAALAVAPCVRCNAQCSTQRASEQSGTHVLLPLLSALRCCCPRLQAQLDAGIVPSSTAPLQCRLLLRMGDERETEADVEVECTMPHESVQ